MKTKRDIIKIQALTSEFGTGSHIILPRSWKGKRVVCMLKTDFDKIKGEKKEWLMLQWHTFEQDAGKNNAVTIEKCSVWRQKVLNTSGTLPSCIEINLINNPQSTPMRKRFEVATAIVCAVAINT